VFVLVRHAHAGHQGRWPGPDDDRPLSGRGRREAAALLATVPNGSVSRLVSSPLLRCRATLAPLAEHLGLAVETSNLLRPEAGAAELDRWLAEAGTAGAVLCTHGETLTRLLDRWRHCGTWDPQGGPDSTQKGGAWLVRADGGRRVATYLPPLAPEPRADG
jgi:8-oxo-dGTP diphosphatase